VRFVVWNVLLPPARGLGVIPMHPHQTRVRHPVKAQILRTKKIQVHPSIKCHHKLSGFLFLSDLSGGVPTTPVCPHPPRQLVSNLHKLVASTCHSNNSLPKPRYPHQAIRLPPHLILFMRDSDMILTAKSKLATNILLSMARTSPPTSLDCQENKIQIFLHRSVTMFSMRQSS
jgi:hypothetical protein